MPTDETYILNLIFDLSSFPNVSEDPLWQFGRFVSFDDSKKSTPWLCSKAWLKKNKDGNVTAHHDKLHDLGIIKVGPGQNPPTIQIAVAGFWMPNPTDYTFNSLAVSCVFGRNAPGCGQTYASPFPSTPSSNLVLASFINNSSRRSRPPH